MVAIFGTSMARTSLTWIPVAGWIVGIVGAVSLAYSLRTYYGAWYRESAWDDIIEIIIVELRKKIDEICIN